MTNTIQRRCSTCCTSNGEKDLFCSNCQAILGSFTLVDATRGQPISNGSLPSPQTGDKPQTPTSTLSEPPPGRQNPPLPGQDPKPSSGPTSEPLLPSSQTRKNVLRLIVFSVAALIIIFSYIVLAVNTYSINPVELTPTPTLTGPINLPHGIDVARAPNGETIGISDGRYVFDKSGASANFKEQAAQELQKGNISSAFPLLDTAHAQDTSDAETLIYKENLRLSTAKEKYITIVLGTVFAAADSDETTFARDDLRGAYIAQKQHNDTVKQHGEVSIRILIASSGSKPENAALVAKQIVELAKNDPTIVGVVGWTLTAQALEAVPLLRDAHLPMVSIASGNNITSIAKGYFFRIGMDGKMQGELDAQYGTKVLKAKSAVVFNDTRNDYINNMTLGFTKNFVGKILATETYTFKEDPTTKAERLKAELQDALKHNPDIIYFAGYSGDVSVLLQEPSLPPNLLATSNGV